MAEGACYMDPLFDAHDQLALEVWARMKTVAAIGGTDYRAALGTLASDATALFRLVNSGQRRGMQLAILLNNADASGATTETPAELHESIKCLRNYDPDMLEMMNLILQCQQGASKAYPQ